MKNRSFRILSLLCAVTLLICAFSAWAAAEETPATPTDLTPVQPQQEPAAAPAQEETEEDGIGTVEVVITKALKLGQSWEGTMSKKKPAVLKLDLEKACTVHMLLEGKDVWATMEKADRRTDNPPRTQTDPETKQAILFWEAEAGSYLITLGPVEPNLLAKAKVTFLDDEAFAAWETEQEETEEAEEPVEEPAEEPVEEPAEEKEEPGTEPANDDIPNDDIPNDEAVIPNEGEETSEETSEPEPEEEPEREINVEVKWDVPYPNYGDTAHFIADVSDYEGLTYTIQWQYTKDKTIWNDIPNATNAFMDVVVNEENNLYDWRILVFLEEEPET